MTYDTRNTSLRAAEADTQLEPEDRLWRAVQARDPAFDDTFCYSVATTGVYCRPSCAARLAKRENVAFHASPQAAERAGFRPCKRCRPDEPSLRTRYAALVEAACRRIEAADELPSLDDLAASADLSRHHFHRVFKAVANVTPRAYADAHRQKRMREQLKSTGTITEAIYDAGFNSSGRFYVAAAGSLGMKPKAYREGGAGAILRVAVGQCSLGAILVAATDKGIAAILLDDDPEILLRDLEKRFPKATFVAGDAAFEDTVAKVVGLVEAPGQSQSPLPLDIRGTAFQHRVWQALIQIPIGTTVTYTEIAERIGMPKAVRAVAAACARNHIAVAIPCHRVVRTGGALAGYRWGIDRKRALLAREAGERDGGDR